MDTEYNKPFQVIPDLDGECIVDISDGSPMFFIVQDEENGEWYVETHTNHVGDTEGKGLSKQEVAKYLLQKYFMPALNHLQEEVLQLTEIAEGEKE